MFCILNLAEKRWTRRESHLKDWNRRAERNHTVLTGRSVILCYNNPPKEQLFRFGHRVESVDLMGALTSSICLTLHPRSESVTVTTNFLSLGCSIQLRSGFDEMTTFLPWL
jgi:hypothetical protein